MKNHGPGLFAALGALVVVYYLFFRNGSAMGRDMISSGPAGAAAPDVSSPPLASQQNGGLLSTILSTTGTSTGSSTSTTKPSTGTTLHSVDVSSRELASQEAVLGQPFRAGIAYAQANDPNVQGPLNLHASAGFGSDAYKESVLMEFLSGLVGLSSGGPGGTGQKLTLKDLT